MELDGIQVNGPDDLLQLVRERRPIQYGERDYRDWLGDFCEAFGEVASRWLDEALLRRADELVGPELKPGNDLTELFRLARQCKVPGLPRKVRERLMAPVEGWSDTDVAGLLGYLLEIRPRHLERAEVDRVI
jgi:hypothetical protein